MTLKITHLKGAYKVKAEGMGLEIISGKDKFDTSYTGLLPSDLLEISLGLCQGLELAAYLNKRYNIEENGFTIYIRTQEKVNCTEFIVDINLHSDYNNRQKKLIMGIIERCGISDIIKGSHKVKVNLK